MKYLCSQRSSKMTFKLVLTTANSIIGVSILTMPYCYKQCGLILATLLIICCAFLVRMCCHLLVKSANLSHSRTYELLAFHSYGQAGKFTVEFCMIGFMMGTCIAFFVVIGDLLPPFVSDWLNWPDHEDKSFLRLWVMVFLGIVVILPISLFRHLDSLTYICTGSIIFYSCVTLYILSTAKSNLISGDWFDSVEWWRPKGIFKSLPIFCMGLSCQPQVRKIQENLILTCLFLPVFNSCILLKRLLNYTGDRIVGVYFHSKYAAKHLCSKQGM